MGVLPWKANTLVSNVAVEGPQAACEELPQLPRLQDDERRPNMGTAARYTGSDLEIQMEIPAIVSATPGGRVLGVCLPQRWMLGDGP